jgi:hypothetical protein
MSGIGVFSDDKRHAHTLSLWHARARFFTDFSSWVAFVSRGLVGTHGVGDDCCFVCMCYVYLYACIVSSSVLRVVAMLLNAPLI